MRPDLRVVVHDMAASMSANSVEDVHLGGPGGVPANVQLVPELPARWQPPPGGAATLGQVSGASGSTQADERGHLPPNQLASGQQCMRPVKKPFPA